MLVQVVSFGSNWWARFGDNEEDRGRFARRACYYNSTGIECGSKVRRHWSVSGLVRFNGVSGFDPHRPKASLHRTFECSGPELMFGGNRLLFERKLGRDAIPDYYLVTLSSDQMGQLDLENASSRAVDVIVLAASRLREQQETMMLMTPESWVSTATGIWLLTGIHPGGKPHLAVAFEEHAA